MTARTDSYALGRGTVSIDGGKPFEVKSININYDYTTSALKVDLGTFKKNITDGTFEMALDVKEVTVYERDFEIWVSGYRATGEHAYAHKLAVARALTFDDAVAKHVASLAPKERTLYKRHPDGRWSCWSCWLHDNETDARKAYG